MSTRLPVWRVLPGVFAVLAISLHYKVDAAPTADQSTSCGLASLDPPATPIIPPEYLSNIGTNETDSSGLSVRSTSSVEGRAIGTAAWTEKVQDGIASWNALQAVLKNSPPQDSATCDVSARWDIVVDFSKPVRIRPVWEGIVPSSIVPITGTPSARKSWYQASISWPKMPPASRIFFYYVNLYSPDYKAIIAADIKGITSSAQSPSTSAPDHCRSVHDLIRYSW